MLQPIVIPPGINVDDTTYAVGQSMWADADKVRFWRGFPQTIGGWQRVATDLLSGVCRTVYPWTDLSGNLLIGFGTHSSLEVYDGGGIYNITPDARFSYGFIPITTNGSGYTSAPTLTFPAAGGGRIAAGTIILNGGVPIGVQITDPGLYTAANLITTPTVSGGGGTGLVLGTPIVSNYIPGNVDGTGGQGWGTGQWGEGEWGEPSSVSNFAATWSLSSYGQNLIANPRGGGIYQWDNDVTQLATLIPGAPPQVNYALVMRTRQIMAFGCNDEETGVYDPLLIRFSDIEDITDWTTQITNNAGSYRLESGGRIIGARLIGDYILVWTDSSVYLGTYQGDTDANNPWTFTAVGDKCGLIGPNAAVVQDQRATWFTPSGQFYGYQLGGDAALLISTLVADLTNNIAPAQGDKIVMSTCAEFSEIRMDYPDARDGNENSRYVAFCTVDGSWTRGTLARTAYCDANPSPYPIGVATSANSDGTYSGTPYYQEIGNSADGAPFLAFVESADFYLNDNPSQVMQIQGCWPDIQGQVGALNLTVYTRMYPQDQKVRVKGPMPLAANQTRKDFQAPAGRVARYRLSSNSAPTFWRAGKWVMNVISTGQQ